MREQLNRVYDAVNQIQDVREQLDGLKKRIVAVVFYKRAVLDGATSLEAKLVAVRDPLINFKISASEDSLAYAPGIDAKLAFLSMGVAGESKIRHPRNRKSTRSSTGSKSRQTSYWQTGIRFEMLTW